MEFNYEKMADKVVTFLKKRPHGATRTEISGRVFNRQVSKEHLDLVMEVVAARGLTHTAMVAWDSNPDRLKTVWVANSVESAPEETGQNDVVVSWRKTRKDRQRVARLARLKRGSVGVRAPDRVADEHLRCVTLIHPVVKAFLAIIDITLDLQRHLARAAVRGKRK